MKIGIANGEIPAPKLVDPVSLDTSGELRTALADANRQCEQLAGIARRERLALISLGTDFGKLIGAFINDEPDAFISVMDDIIKRRVSIGKPMEMN